MPIVAGGKDSQTGRTDFRGSGQERNFYRDLWKPTQQRSGIDIRPHECRHSYVTHLRAKGINDADLAEIAGHRVETMLARYTHSVGNSFEEVRTAIA